MAIGGCEAQEVTDSGGRHEQAIEVTRDGPYRITGGIALGGADGAVLERKRGRIP